MTPELGSSITIGFVYLVIGFVTAVCVGRWVGITQEKLKEETRLCLDKL